MDLVLPDSVISREKSEILVEYLHKVFCERCGMNLKIQLQFEGLRRVNTEKMQNFRSSRRLKMC